MKTKLKAIIAVSITIAALTTLYASGILYQTQNADCWYDNGDGILVPCKIDTGPILFAPPPPDEECKDQCPDESENTQKKTIDVKGEIAQEICRITGGECPPSYPGNVQDDGSVMVGFVISDGDKFTHYQFFIRDDKLTYDKTSLGAEE